MTIRILAVTARKKYPRWWIANLWRRLDLQDDIQLKILAAKKPQRKFDAEFFSIAPEPAAPPEPRGWRRLVAGLSGTGTRPPAKLSLGERLAEACRTAAEPAELAEWADVVVAMDDVGCLGVWELSRRVPGTLYVNRMAQVRKLLEDHGHTLAPTASSAIEPELDSTSGPELAAAVDDDRMPPLPAVPTRLLIAPANYAGQAHAWAQAVNRHVPGAAAQNFKDQLLKNPYPNDLAVDRLRFQGDLEWRRYWRDHVSSTYTHVIVEAGLPVLNDSSMPLEQVVAELRALGLRVALLAHGTDARIPSVHSANEPWAPYTAMEPGRVRLLETISRRNVEVYTTDAGPVLLSTPGLLEFVPNGTWLPLVVDVDRWHTESAVLERSRPIVAHAPSGNQKGSHHIDPVLTDLEGRGLIEYRRVQGVPPEEMLQVYGTADIVVDQFGAADYGVAACEAMASGRLVVSHVSTPVREHVLKQTGLELPIIEADPDTLGAVISAAIVDRSGSRSTADAGRRFVRDVHAGARSAEVLRGWLAPDGSAD